jgi:hypothetical protein
LLQSREPIEETSLTLELSKADILENVISKEGTNEVDFEDVSHKILE